MFYTIGEMAKLLDVEPSTLRYYDKEGLLPFVKRTKGNVRLFTDSDYEWLKIIDCLKKTKMSLKDIKTFIYMAMEGDKTINERLEIFQRQKQEIESQIAELEKTLDIISFKCWYYAKAKEAGTTEVPSNMDINDIPEEFREVRNDLRRLK